MKTRLRWAGAALAIGLCAAVSYFAVSDRSTVAADPATEGKDKSAASTPASESSENSPAPQPINRELTRSGKPPAESDTLVLAYPQDPDTINPITSNDTVSEALQRLVYDALADRKFSDPDVWEPALAESWTFDPAEREYTIHLRKGVKWQPITLPGGKELPATEFTARDVQFTFECILNKFVLAPHLRSYYEDSDEAHTPKIEVSLVHLDKHTIDKYTIKVKWLKPYFMADEFTLGVGIIPRHVFSVDKNGDPISLNFSSKEFADGFNDHWANQQMCGTGPMRFKEWVKEQRVVLERNPDYWGQPFYFSRLVYKHISNPNTALQMMLQNQLDWNPIGEKDLYVESKKNPNVVDGKVILKEYDYPSYRYVGYNLKRDFFKDKRVRTALGHAVPVDEIINTIYHGLAVRITGPFLPSSPGNDPSLKPLTFDLDEARRLLDDAGWKLAEGESVRSKVIDGSKVEAFFDLLIMVNSPSFKSIAEVIKENCRRIGVRVQITSAEWALLLQKTRKKDFDAVLLGWAMGWKDDPYQIWSGAQADEPDSSNSIGYDNADVNKWIDELRVTMDRPKQIELYRKIDRQIYDDQPYTFLFMDKATAGYDARIQNVKFYKIRPCIDVREWYSTKPRSE